MKLSILICSLEWRGDYLDRLLREVYSQINGLFFISGKVEVLIDIDHKEVTTGAKRNRLLLRAKGEYIVFIDDDDMIYPIYLFSILKAIESGADCIATSGHYSVDGGAKQLWKLSKDYVDHDHGGILYRRTNHISPVRREHALKAMFPDISKAEDKEYSERLNQYLKTEVVIEDPIYHYEYKTANKEY